MKYDKDTTNKLLADFDNGNGKSVKEIAEELGVPERSVIAKLSSLGVYKAKGYLNKRGEVPVKKGEYIERIAELLDTNIELLESLEKANKNVLALIEKALQKTD